MRWINRNTVHANSITGVIKHDGRVGIGTGKGGRGPHARHNLAPIQSEFVDWLKARHYHVGENERISIAGVRGGLIEVAIYDAAKFAGIRCEAEAVPQ